MTIINYKEKLIIIIILSKFYNLFSSVQH